MRTFPLYLLKGAPVIRHSLAAAVCAALLFSPAAASAAPPVVTITSGPAEGSQRGGPAPIEIAFTVDVPATVVCTYGRHHEVPCSSPVSLPAQEDGVGTSGISIVARNADGGGFANRSWQNDVKPPNAVLGAQVGLGIPGATFVDGMRLRPQDVVFTGRYSLELAPGETDTCALDGAPLTCAEQMTFPDLPNGTHSISMTSTDAWGNAITRTLSWISVSFYPPTAGKDKLHASKLADLVHALAGNDQVWGEDGDDTLYGDAGDDTLDGGRGKDKLFGRAGIDTLWGFDGDDRLVGDAGDDHLAGENGKDTLTGGPGNDTLIDVDDSVRDVLNCGPGKRDVAFIRKPDVTVGCEKVYVSVRGRDLPLPKWYTDVPPRKSSSGPGAPLVD